MCTAGRSPDLKTQWQRARGLTHDVLLFLNLATVTCSLFQTLHEEACLLKCKPFKARRQNSVFAL